ncbi:MAG: DNA polymerase III subunit gamma/tau [Inconstantimicrobium porci]|uniref:DNA polymerase III subunit gamma/tau n=1 Tax=Inconstantimicrobium porci TaxID=2652291 RepID=UPI002A9118C5|nr:DNA polymerase III subunit gamma/tau [Inconstantimicrobium porci]MDY5912636.1 DNA polymerase III subunit gamma/tau [Inconstantimicrobium porci]
MGYTALYREWRPKSFDDVVGQEHITTTLKNQILNDRIAHAYLFCGTRGTGKTSTAKVFAKALNCLNLKDGEPCNECEMCKKINSGLSMDVTELDAASNNGVDKIRDIIDDVQYPPQESKYKVYIMDEVHMLSQGAVNAFLKTLEEPPKNVVFILATTDPQKLPITILSRCQRFDFKRISLSDITKLERKIVDSKGVFADDNSLKLIARVADGAMRDSLSILDQAISMGDGKVTYDSIVSMLGLVTDKYLFELTDAVIDRSVEKSMNIIEEIVHEGKDIYSFIKDMIGHYRNLLMLKVTSNPEEVLDMSNDNIENLRQQSQRMRSEEIMRGIRVLQEAEESAKLSKQSRIYLELAIIKMCKIEYDTSKEVLLARINKLENVIRSGNIKVNPAAQGEQAEEKQTSAAKKIETPMAAKKAHVSAPENDVRADDNLGATVTINDVQKSWKDILEAFKSRRKMVIYASLVTGRPIECKNGVIDVNYEAEFAFNKIRLEKSDNAEVVNEVFSEILGQRVRVRYTTVKQKEAEGSEDIEQELKDKLGDGFQVYD